MDFVAPDIGLQPELDSTQSLLCARWGILMNRPYRKISYAIEFQP